MGRLQRPLGGVFSGGRSMSTLILATKLHIPRPPPQAVRRPRLVERLNEGLHRKLTLVSGAAGLGKTTLLSAWVAGSDLPVAWLVSITNGTTSMLPSGTRNNACN